MRRIPMINRASPGWISMSCLTWLILTAAMCSSATTPLVGEEVKKKASLVGRTFKIQVVSGNTPMSSVIDFRDQHMKSSLWGSLPFTQTAGRRGETRFTGSSTSASGDVLTVSGAARVKDGEIHGSIEITRKDGSRDAKNFKTLAEAPPTGR